MPWLPLHMALELLLPCSNIQNNNDAGAIVGISCGIVILLFMGQRFGTGRIGFCFAPIVLVYFLCNLIIAITNISRYKPDIFKVNFLIAANNEGLMIGVPWLIAWVIQHLPVQLLV